MSFDITFATATSAPKIRQYLREYGERTTRNLLVIVLRSFVDSARVSQRPDASDLMEIADDLIKTYYCDSIEDFILALKQSRTRGIKLYDSLDSGKIYSFINDYFERKSQFLENRHKDQKTTGPSYDSAVAGMIANAPQVQTMI